MSDATSTHTGMTERLTELADGERICMMTTVDPAGTLVSRPMAHQKVTDVAELWFFAERDSRKVAHIRANCHVSLTMASSDTWISIDGTAEVVEDTAKAKELWNPWVEAWMPQGPEDPSVVLLKVTGSSGEYWDTPGSRISSALSLVKAKVTGERYDGGENERVQL
ncbi:pyridoxamine 5'-phosphate oxidase family protein [uncultured Nocardioides sp.]|uniref:pyridoxamine 5'-phosphate oxidase family protein n=1 Tax=uncultured Nocardioides sp. TaxID=198441 RepID=UPI002604F79C|nr:pyridoxamine 5'-phosphate oxidase family protein [uncultured Nocardioides sp.]